MSKERMKRQTHQSQIQPTKNTSQQTETQVSVAGIVVGLVVAGAIIGTLYVVLFGSKRTEDISQVHDQQLLQAAPSPPQEAQRESQRESPREIFIIAPEISIDGTVTQVPVSVMAKDDSLLPSTKSCCGGIVSSVVNPACKPMCGGGACAFSCGAEMAPVPFLHRS